MQCETSCTLHWSMNISKEAKCNTKITDLSMKPLAITFDSDLLADAGRGIRILLRGPRSA